MIRFFIVAILIVPQLLLAERSVSQEEHAEEVVQEMFGSLMSPFCPGRLLRDCPSSSATELKHDVLARIKRGESREAIEESLFVKYGGDLRAVPQARSFGLVGWLAPFAFFVVGAGIFYWWFTLRKEGADTMPPVSRGSLSSELKEKIQRAVDSD